MPKSKAAKPSRKGPAEKVKSSTVKLSLEGFKKSFRKAQLIWEDDDGDFCVVSKLDDNEVVCYSGEDGTQIGVDRRPSSTRKARQLAIDRDHAKYEKANEISRKARDEARRHAEIMLKAGGNIIG